MLLIILVFYIWISNTVNQSILQNIYQNKSQSNVWITFTFKFLPANSPKLDIRKFQIIIVGVCLLSKTTSQFKKINKNKFSAFQPEFCPDNIEPRVFRDKTKCWLKKGSFNDGDCCTLSFSAPGRSDKLGDTRMQAQVVRFRNTEQLQGLCTHCLCN